jgi:multicomponent Na+:H+ antiporter subunit E
VYANSITLTPGTIAINVDEDMITVHALSREGAEDLKSGEMDARVSALERAK